MTDEDKELLAKIKNTVMEICTSNAYHFGSPIPKVIDGEVEFYKTYLEVTPSDTAKQG